MPRKIPRMSVQPDLAVIIPVYNEAARLPLLLSQLAEQRDIRLEIIVVDGGSTDESYQLCTDFMQQFGASCQCLSSPLGRAKQLNHGARTATAGNLLFLHADSRLDAPEQLSRALAQMQATRQALGHDYLAGHFHLQFADTENRFPGGFYFYAAKTGLSRPDTINGDQGFLLSKVYFRALGGFDTRLPYMEDAKLAHKIFQTGQWISLEGVIHSSARRFLSEGFKQRQILNAFLCNFQAMGLEEFFLQAQQAYRPQHQAGNLALRPFLRIIHRLMHADGAARAFQRWYQTGSYIASNAWQLAFALDCRRSRRRGLPPMQIQTRYLDYFDRYMAGFFRLKLTRLVTGLLTILWFYSLFIVYR